MYYYRRRASCSRWIFVCGYLLSLLPICDVDLERILIGLFRLTGPGPTECWPCPLHRPALRLGPPPCVPAAGAPLDIRFVYGSIWRRHVPPRRRFDFKKEKKRITARYIYIYINIFVSLLTQWGKEKRNATVRLRRRVHSPKIACAPPAMRESMRRNDQSQSNRKANENKDGG